MKKRRIISMMLFVCLMFSMCSFSANATSTPSSWATDEINLAKEKGLTYDGILSDYQSNITRGEFCKLAVSYYKAMGGEMPSIDVSPFHDTNDKDIILANALGIVNGVSETEFEPNDLVTREQIAAMMVRAIDIFYDTEQNNDLTGYSDYNEISSWAKESLAFLNGMNIIKGVSETSIAPQDNTTREQAILIVYRTFTMKAETATEAETTTEAETPTEAETTTQAETTTEIESATEENIYEEIAPIAGANCEIPLDNGEYYIMIMGKFVYYDGNGGYRHLVLKDSIPEKPFIMNHQGADLKTGYHLYTMVLDGRTIGVDNMNPYIGQLGGLFFEGDDIKWRIVKYKHHWSVRRYRDQSEIMCVKGGSGLDGAKIVTGEYSDMPDRSRFIFVPASEIGKIGAQAQIVSRQTKTEYYIGEGFDTAGLKAQLKDGSYITDISDKVKITANGNNIQNGYAFQSEGTKNIKYYYEDKLIHESQVYVYKKPPEREIPLEEGEYYIKINGKYASIDDAHMYIVDSKPKMTIKLERVGIDYKTGYHLYYMSASGMMYIGAKSTCGTGEEWHLSTLGGSQKWRIVKNDGYWSVRSASDTSMVVVARKARYGGETVIVLESHPTSNPDNAHIQFVKVD